jgi:hypothetical protein
LLLPQLEDDVVDVDFRKFKDLKTWVRLWKSSESWASSIASTVSQT